MEPYVPWDCQGWLLPISSELRMQGLPEVGTVCCEDFMDDGTAIRLAVTIDRKDGSACFDFAGTGPEVLGNTNAPPAVTTSAVLYSLRCLVSQDIPLNGGCLNPVTIQVRVSGHPLERRLPQPGDHPGACCPETPQHR